MNFVNFVFFGTPEFAAIILEKLIKAGYVPVAVVCNPDRPVGRKQVITPPLTKLLIADYKLLIDVLQPETLDADFISQISKLNPDLFIVAAYAKIIPKEVLDVPRLGLIGVHPSLLPKYRGASPIQATILNGEKETGVTLFLMDEKVDHGEIIADCRLQIADADNYESLTKKLADLGADLLIETLPKFIKGEITPLPQDETQATYTKKFKTEDAYIEPKDLEKAQGESGETAVQIDRKIRALNPEPGTWTIKDGKRMKILEAELIDGKLKITRLQVEGKRPIEL